MAFSRFGWEKQSGPGPRTGALLSEQHASLHFGHCLFLASFADTVSEKPILLSHEEEAVREGQVEEVLDSRLSEVEKSLEWRPCQNVLEGNSASRTPVRIPKFVQAETVDGLPVLTVRYLGLGFKVRGSHNIKIRTWNEAHRHG